MDCIKIITISRLAKSTDYIMYYLFETKLIEVVRGKSVLKEYRFASTSDGEKKLTSILKRKLSIGYNVLATVKDTRVYTYLNKRYKSFDTLFASENGIKEWYNHHKDSDGDYYFSIGVTKGTEYLSTTFPKAPALVSFLSYFSSYDIQTDFCRNELSYVYRFSVHPFNTNIVRTESSPYSIRDCALGKSLIEYISVETGLSLPTIHDRVIYFSKGLFSFVDTHTDKVYCVEEYEPDFTSIINSKDILVFDTVFQFIEYALDRLYDDISYSLSYK